MVLSVLWLRSSICGGYSGSFAFPFFLFLLYNTVLVLPYIDMNPPWVYMSSQSWTPHPPPSPYHLSGSSQCNSPKHPVSYIKPRLAICFLHGSIHVSTLESVRQYPKNNFLGFWFRLHWIYNLEESTSLQYWDFLYRR